jgi:hypothetical protein
MKTKILVAVALFIGVVVAPGVARASFAIRVQNPVAGRGEVTQIGPWSMLPRSMSDPSVSGAIGVFGEPSSRRAVRPGFANAPGIADCRLTWNVLGLSVVFTTLNIEPGTCNPRKVVWIATITQRRNWRTWAGLRIGDSTRQLRARHPHATLHHGVWWLATTNRPFGNHATIPTVSATTRGGRIDSFHLDIQAQGE